MGEQIQREKMVLQIHITGACNLHCKHCYMEHHQPKELQTDKIENIVEEFKLLALSLNKRPHINLTGGEPFLHSDIWGIVDIMDKNRLSYGILTNGTLLTDSIAQRLSKSDNLRFVQISLDGTRKVHEGIRGEGSFGKALNGIRHLRNNSIQSMISFTLTKSNYKDINKVIKVVNRVGADRFWCDRVVSIGGNTEIAIDSEEYKWAIEQLVKWQNKKFVHTRVQANRALQFCYGGNEIYQCSAGDNLIIVCENGDIYPCRRLPIKVGNIYEDNLAKVYRNNEILKYLRNHDIPDECTKCCKAMQCRGGAKCLSYAVTGKLNIKDINCIQTEV